VFFCPAELSSRSARSVLAFQAVQYRQKMSGRTISPFFYLIMQFPKKNIYKVPFLPKMQFRGDTSNNTVFPNYSNFRAI